MSKTKKTTPKAAKTRGLRWSIGLFRNEAGKLITVYVSADGAPMPYEKKRVRGKILFHAVYTGVKYSQARQQLLKDSKLKDARPAKEKAKLKRAA